MPLVINTTEVNGPFNQAGTLLGYQFAKDDYDTGCAVADIYKTGGRLIEAKEQANELQMYKKRDFTKLPGFFTTENGALIIHADVFQAIQVRDQDAHQALPLTLTYLGEAIEPNPWYLLNVWRRVDAIDQSRSAIREVKGFDRKVRRKLDFHQEQVVMNAGANEGLHLWRDAQFPSALMLSDELADELEGQKLLKAVSRFRTVD